MKIVLTVTIISFLIACSSKTINTSETNTETPRQAEINIPMKDGITLSTSIFLPKRKGKYPTVLVRTPYDKNAEQWMGKAFNFLGIAVVIQDVRGKHKSGGEFYPFINERADGLQTLKWIRSQQWADGKVAGWGSSYLGYTQWSISDSLNFLTMMVTGANIYDFTYPDSLFSLQSALNWGLQNASSGLNNVSAMKLKAAAMMLPLSIADDSTVKDIPFYNDWLAHEKYDNYWNQMNFRGKTNAQIISMAGWYDIFLKSQIRDFQALEKSGNPNNRLIIGPWAHGSLAEPNEYGGLKKTGKPQQIFMYVKNYLKGNKTRLKSPLKDKKYNLFIMERNEYAGSDVWPPVETSITPYFVGPSGYLNTIKYENNGSLQYIYSPADPFPSHGGTALGDGVGPAKQNENLNRKDQLSFERNIDKEPMILLGPISATLWVSSNVACTDFYVGLQDVFPDGKIINIQEGGARVKVKGSEPQKTEISVWATGYQLNPGHKLKVIITSSLFPRFNRNLNGCTKAFVAIETINADQKVYYGTETPSCINLPLYNMNHNK